MCLKKYLSNQKNGILFINFNTDAESKYKFNGTNEFQVYCFCPIKEILYKTEHKVNEKSDHLIDSEFFFAGGFDKKERRGQIKLYKLEIDSNKNVKGIKFLQDIEIEKEENNTSSKPGDENGNNTKKEFKGFKGAISSMIQSTMSKEILVSCYDGKIFQLSQPNLSKYGKNLNY